MNSLMKIFQVTFSLCLIFSLTSCTTEHVDEKDIKENAIKMMECVVNENAEELFAFYSSDMSDRKDKYQKEIEQLFEYIDGAIISYDYEGTGGGIETIHDGKICFYLCNPEFDFTTDTNKAYTISFGYVYIDDKSPECEGVYMIQVCENGDWSNKLAIGDIV